MRPKADYLQTEAGTIALLKALSLDEAVMAARLFSGEMFQDTDDSFLATIVRLLASTTSEKDLKRVAQQVAWSIGIPRGDWGVSEFQGRLCPWFKTREIKVQVKVSHDRGGFYDMDILSV